jgi:hypothetical protein
MAMAKIIGCQHLQTKASRERTAMEGIHIRTVLTGNDHGHDITGREVRKTGCVRSVVSH